MTIIHRRMSGTIIHRYAAGNLQAVGARQFRGIAATDALCADGYALDIAGGNLDRLQNGALSWNHREPIGSILETSKAQHEIRFLAEFDSAGVDPEVDVLCRKLKDGGIKGVSLSFDVRESVPLPGGRGLRATKWDALEIALCLVGVDPGAQITQRSQAMLRTSDAMTAQLAHLEQAIEARRAVGRHHAEMADTVGRLQDHDSNAGTALRAARRAAAAGDTQTAIECVGRCNRSLDGMKHESRLLGDRHNDAVEAHTNLARAVEDADDALVQSSGGTADDQGGRSADFRRRQRRLAELSDFERRQRQLEVLRLAAPD